MEYSVVEKALQAYGVAYRRILAPQKGYRNTSYAVETARGTLNFIIYKNEDDILTRIQNANRVGNFLAAQGWPARQTYSPNIIKLTSRAGTIYGALYYYLPGQTIPWEAYTMDHLKSLGKTMSDMHAALAAYYALDVPDVADESIALNKRMIRYFNDKNVAQALRDKLELKVTRSDFTTLLTACKQLPDKQTLHMDFVRGNILFEGTQITGIIDFEKTARGSVLFDIARTLAFLLVDCKYKEPHKIRKYFLYSGYIKRGSHSFQNLKINNMDDPNLEMHESLFQPSGKDEVAYISTSRYMHVFDALILFFLLHDFYKFLRHNPYESLPANEHFTRTKAMLLKHRLITPVRVK